MDNSSDVLLVDHAVETVSHQIRPETAFYDVVDLMVKKSVEAVPVVGDSGEVLGIIGSEDVLDRVLRDLSLIHI